MHNLMVQPFNQFTNWFRLEITGNECYEITTPSKEDRDSNSVINIRERSFTLEPREGCVALQPNNELLKSIILKGFGDALKEKGFSFKGAQENITYWADQPLSTHNNEIFSAYTTSFEYRVIHYFDGEMDQFYLVLDPHLTFTINMSIAGLIGRSIAPSKLKNLAVRMKRDDEDGRRSGIDDFLIETRLEGDKGAICKVIDARTGESAEVDGSSVYLEPRPEIIKFILQELGDKFDVIKFQRMKSYIDSPIASKERFGKTQEIVRDYLLGKGKVFPLSIGNFRIQLLPDPVPVVGGGYPRARRIFEPPILFDQTDSSATHLQAYWGLRTHGPFTKNLPTIRLGLLGTSTGVKALNTLIADMNRGTRIMLGGMPRFFSTRFEVAQEEIISSDSLDSYIQGAKSLGLQNDRHNNVDVVITHLTRATSEWDLETPYYCVKPILMDHGLPSQMVTGPKLLGSNAQWIHADLASAIFAKAGGHPWVLANNIPNFDMILGVGLSTAISKTKRAGAHPRYIGYANVFDDLGRWMFFESTSQLYDVNRHGTQLAELVSIGVERYQKERKRKPNSIAIHYYKRFSREERTLVVETLKKKIGEHQVAFIAIDKSHPMRLYDTQIPDGSFPRGHYAELSDKEFLLSTTGHTELAKKRLGTPQILKITIDQSPEPFVAIKEVANQVMALTRLNYKTLSPCVGEPVTLLFSHLVAKFTSVFSQGQWKDAQANGSSKLNTRPWFL